MNYAWSLLFIGMSVGLFLASDFLHFISLKRDHRQRVASIGRWTMVGCSAFCGFMAYVAWTSPDPSTLAYIVETLP